MIAKNIYVYINRSLAEDTAQPTVGVATLLLDLHPPVLGLELRTAKN